MKIVIKGTHYSAMKELCKYRWHSVLESSNTGTVLENWNRAWKFRHQREYLFVISALV